METTNDPTKVFEQYEEGVEVHDDKSITISLDVQRDILNATSGLMHEQKKLQMILALVLGMMMESHDHDQTIDRAKMLITAYFDDPDDVSFYEAESMEEVKDIINALEMSVIDEDEVKN